MGRRGGYITANVLDELQRNPCRSSVDIAKVADASPSWVRKLAAIHGFKVGTRGGGRFAGVSPENMRFLREEATRLNCSTRDMVNAIITDARIDAEETSGERP